MVSLEPDPKRLPEEMTVVAIAAPGGPEQLTPAKRPVPTPGPGEVLIAVAAAGVNRPDLMQRQGKYPPPPGITDIPGLEVAGRIVAVGAAVEHWRVGDIVCALLAGGGYAQYAVAPQEQVLPVPQRLTLPEAAALPETCFTVWANVFDFGRLAAGERFLVHGGTSGIGTTAIQMARAMGAEVFTTAGSTDKCACCEKLGARLAVNYREQDFVAAIREATQDEGVDVVLDMVGGDYLPKNISLLRPGGRHLSIAFLQGSRAEIDFAPVLGKHLTLAGSTLRPRSAAEKGRLAEGLRRQIWPLIEAGEIRPVIDTSFHLENAAEAHRRMESSEHIGKLVLRP